MRLAARIVLGLAFALSLAGTSRAAPLIFESSLPLLDEEATPAGERIGLLGRITVAGADVEITGIGVFGRVLAPASMKWVVFEDIILSAPIFETAVVSVSPGSLDWIDSPSFAPVTLEDGGVYYIGAVFDGTFSFAAHFNSLSGCVPLTQSGITQPCGFGANQNATGTLGAPLLQDNPGFAQMGIRLYGVPEPSTQLLMCLGLTFLALHARGRVERID